MQLSIICEDLVVARVSTVRHYWETAPHIPPLHRATSAFLALAYDLQHSSASLRHVSGDFSLTSNLSSGCSVILSRYLPEMQIMTVGMAEAQQERLKKREHLAKSRSARWRNNTRILLALPFRFTAMVWEELKDRRRVRLAKKLSEQPPYKPLVLRNGTRSSQTQSKLLALPAEIRLMIWEHVVGGKLIVLHRKSGKLMHRSLEKEGAASVTNATGQIVKQMRLDSAATPTTSKERFLALLQTCQIM
jgi:hypothetical protein